MEKREVLIKLFNAELERWKSSNNWYGLIDETAEGYTNSIEELVDELFGANL